MLPLINRAAVVLPYCDRFSIRIDENLGSVEPLSVRGVVWSLRSIHIDLPRFQLRDEDVPVVAHPIDLRAQSNGLSRCECIDMIEERDNEAGGARREDTEISALWRESGS